MITGLIYALGIPLITGGSPPPLSPTTAAELAQQQVDDSDAPEIMEPMRSYVTTTNTEMRIGLKKEAYYSYEPFLTAIAQAKNLYDAQKVLAEHGFYTKYENPRKKVHFTGPFSESRKTLHDSFLMFCAQKNINARKAQLDDGFNSIRTSITQISNTRALGSFMWDQFVKAPWLGVAAETAVAAALTSRYMPEKISLVSLAGISAAVITGSIALRAVRSCHTAYRKLSLINSIILEIQNGTHQQYNEATKTYAVGIGIADATHLRMNTLNTSELIG